MPLEQVTERLRGAIPILTARAELRAQGEALQDKLFAHIAPVGWELISFNGDYVWPSEALKQKVRPCEICAQRSSMPLEVHFWNRFCDDPCAPVGNDLAGSQGKKDASLSPVFPTL